MFTHYLKLRPPTLWFFLLALCGAASLTFGRKPLPDVATQNDIPTTSLVQLEQINGTLNYRIYGKKGRDDNPWLSGRGMDMQQHIECVRRGKCEKRVFSRCLGAKVPHEYTSLDLTDFRSQLEMLEQLNKSRALQHVPKCWAVIQPFLCAVFAPKCERINDMDMVHLPSLEMCRITMEPCRILYNTSYFPEFLRCNETHFPSKCSNDVREMKFNITGSCLQPLVPTDLSANSYPGIEGCGVRCRDPMYTDDEHRQIHKLIGWGASLCLLCSLFGILTYLIDFKVSSNYPALIIFYINGCFLVASIGFLAQFGSDSRDDIVCRKDGTLRRSEPTAGENLSCVAVFVFIYYPIMAAMIWFVFLAYCWHLRTNGGSHDYYRKYASYFHLIAWSLPLVLTIMALAMSEVDGNSTVGICFVGYASHDMRIGLLLAPLALVVTVGTYFIVRGIVSIFYLPALRTISHNGMKRIRRATWRMGYTATSTLIFVLVSFACHITEFRHTWEWDESLKNYVICSISSTFLGEHEQIACKFEHRPNVAALQLHLLCFFGAGISMASWSWTTYAKQSWCNFFCSRCNDQMEEVRMPKHKIMAQMWAKRKEYEEKGRLSIALYNSHTDPMGLNFDLNDMNSYKSSEISSTWANYLPQFVKRRMAITGVATTNSSSQGPPRKNSLDSEISFSVRHVSVESRRNSVDSQVSVKIAEMKTKVASRSRGHHHHSKHASAAATKRTQRRRDFYASATGRKYSGTRRGSSTSIESQTFALNKITYPNAGQKLGIFAQSTKHNSSRGGVGKNTKRRSANAGLTPADLNFILPFLQNQGMTTSSSEEETAFKINDSRLNVVYKHELSNDDDFDEQQNDDDNDGGGGMRIEEIQETPPNRTNNRNNAKKQAAIENILKHIHKSNESATLQQQRHSRNSTRSRQSSRKSQAATATADVLAVAVASAANNNNKTNSNRSRSQLRTNNKIKAATEDSISSYSSVELDIPLELMMLQQSFCSDGGLSVEKPNSRNSKTSCDVGIQANAFDIAAMQSIYGDEDEQQRKQAAMRQLNAKNRRFDDDATMVNATEMHALLHVGSGGGVGGKKHQIQNFRDLLPHKETEAIMSESEKLKILLLPISTPTRNN